MKQGKLPNFDATALASQSIDELELVWEDVKRLDLTEVEALLGEKAVLDIQIQRCEGTISDANQRIGQNRTLLAAQQQVVGQKEAAIPNRKQRVTEELRKLKAVCEANSGLSYVAMEAQVEELLVAGQGPQNLQEAVQNLQVRAREYTSDVREAVGEYNQSARQDEKLEFPYGDNVRKATSRCLWPAGPAALQCSRAAESSARNWVVQEPRPVAASRENSSVIASSPRSCYEIRNVKTTPAYERSRP